MLIFFYFIQAFEFTTNHHLNDRHTLHHITGKMKGEITKSSWGGPVER